MHVHPVHLQVLGLVQVGELGLGRRLAPATVKIKLKIGQISSLFILLQTAETTVHCTAFFCLPVFLIIFFKLFFCEGLPIEF